MKRARLNTAALGLGVSVLAGLMLSTMVWAEDVGQGDPVAVSEPSQQAGLPQGCPVIVTDNIAPVFVAGDGTDGGTGGGSDDPKAGDDGQTLATDDVAPGPAAGDGTDGGSDDPQAIDDGKDGSGDAGQGGLPDSNVLVSLFDAGCDGCDVVRTFVAYDRPLGAGASLGAPGAAASSSGASGAVARAPAGQALGACAVAWLCNWQKNVSH